MQPSDASMKNLFIGDNAFIGVSHLSQVKAREQVEGLHLDDVPNVFERAISHGANGYTFSTHPVNHRILEILHTANIHIDLYPILPYAESYVRLVNEKGLTGMVRDIMSRLPLSSKAKVLTQAGISIAKSEPVGLLNAYVDTELTSYMRTKQQASRLNAVILHEAVTDLALSFETRHLFDSFIEHIKEKYHTRPGFVTRNFVRFVDFFLKQGLALSDVLIMTPFNRIGFQMNPSREACENCLSDIANEHVIAISPLAGGYLGLNEAVSYLREFQNLSGIAVGVASTQQAEETFSKLNESLTINHLFSHEKRLTQQSPPTH